MSLTAQPTTSFDLQSPLDGGSPGRQSNAESKLVRRAKMLVVLGLFGISFVVGFIGLGPIAWSVMGDSDAPQHSTRIGKFAHAHPGLLKPVANAVAKPDPLFGMHPDVKVRHYQMKPPLSPAKEMTSAQVEELREHVDRLRQQTNLELMQVEALEKELGYMEAQTDEPAQVRAPAKASLMQVLLSLVMWVSAGVGVKAIYKLVAKPAPAPARSPAMIMSANQPLRRYPVNQSRCRAPVMVVAPQDEQEGKGSAVARSVEPTMTTSTEPEVDIYRDTVLRYAGYLNEVGEAFRPLVSVWIVYLSYVLALTYVSADALSKGGQTAALPMNVGIKGCGLAAVIDTLTFQLLASVIFPSTIINRGVALTIYLEEQFGATSFVQQAFGAEQPDQMLVSLGGVGITPESIVETFPTAVGLLLIPAIVKPIDAVVEQILDNIVRPWLDTTFSECTLPFCDREACEMPDN